MSALPKQEDRHPDTVEVVVNRVPIVWDGSRTGFSFFGVDSIIFWTNPSLVSILRPLRDALGGELYALLLAFEASKGTYEDYHAMVSSLGSSFEEGFVNWGKAVSAAGWGVFSIDSISWKDREAFVRIDDPWELKVFRSDSLQENAPFLNGKISGIFSHAFGTHCRSAVERLETNKLGSDSIFLRVRPSSETLEQALMGVQGRVLDAQKQLRAVNDALRRNQQRVFDILDTVGEFIWESDLNLTLTYVSRKASSVLRLPETNLVGRKWDDLIWGEDLGSLDDSLKALWSGQAKFVESIVRLQSPEGAPVWIALRVKPVLDFSGNPIGYVGSGLDITDRRQLESELEDQRKQSFLSAKMASLGEMAGGIAHEINNPLAIIVGRTGQVKRELECETPDLEAVREAVERIEETSKRISRIIRGLLDFSRDGNGDPFRIVDVGSLAEDTIELCKERFRHHLIPFELKVTSGLEIRCRSTQISQILINLLNNAFDAVLGTREPWVRMEVSANGADVLISVTDSGNGIPDELAEKIMQPFFTTKEVGKGTGLGLSISKGICESHGGSLFLDRASPRTRFVVRLPRHFG